MSDVIEDQPRTTDLVDLPEALKPTNTLEVKGEQYEIREWEGDLRAVWNEIEKRHKLSQLQATYTRDILPRGQRLLTAERELQEFMVHGSKKPEAMVLRKKRLGLAKKLDKLGADDWTDELEAELTKIAEGIQAAEDRLEELKKQDIHAIFDEKEQVEQDTQRMREGAHAAWSEMMHALAKVEHGFDGTLEEYRKGLNDRDFESIGKLVEAGNGTTRLNSQARQLMKLLS